MTPSDTHRFPDDLHEVAALLRDNRPEATALELDGVKQQVRLRASRAASRHAQKGSTMKSRLAMMAMLVSGLLMSGTGATLAFSDSDPGASASTEQYPQTVVPTPIPPSGPQNTPSDTKGQPAPSSGVLPDSTSGGTPPKPSGTTPAKAPESKPESKGGTPPASTREQGAAPAVQGAQPAAQKSVSDTTSLPFTGFAAIPILVGGIALMGGGLVMRRRTAA